MRLLLDQMLREELAEQLRTRDTTWCVSRNEGSRVPTMLDPGASNSRGTILVTIDGDFGDWVTLPLSEHLGVIRIRVQPTTSSNVARLLLPLIRERTADEFRNHLVIVSESRTRWVRTNDR